MDGCLEPVSLSVHLPLQLTAEQLCGEREGGHTPCPSSASYHLTHPHATRPINMGFSPAAPAYKRAVAWGEREGGHAPCPTSVSNHALAHPYPTQPQLETNAHYFSL